MLSKKSFKKKILSKKSFNKRNASPIFSKASPISGHENVFECLQLNNLRFRPCCFSTFEVYVILIFRPCCFSALRFIASTRHYDSVSSFCFSDTRFLLEQPRNVMSQYQISPARGSHVPWRHTGSGAGVVVGSPHNPVVHSTIVLAESTSSYPEMHSTVHKDPSGNASLVSKAVPPAACDAWQEVTLLEATPTPPTGAVHPTQHSGHNTSIAGDPRLYSSQATSEVSIVEPQVRHRSLAIVTHVVVTVKMR